MTSLRKALTLVDYLGENAQRHPVRLVDIVRGTGISKPTAHRLLRELQDYGLVHQEPGSGYRIGPKALVLAAQYRGAADLQREALPLMRELAAHTGANIHLGMRDGLSAVYVEKIDSPHAIRLASRVGQRAPLHCTAMGKVILAFSREDLLAELDGLNLERRTAGTRTSVEALRPEIEAIRERGFAVDEQENEPGVRCVAAPIFDHAGELAATMSISGTLEQVDREQVESLGKLARQHCRRLTRILGGGTPADD